MWCCCSILCGKGWRQPCSQSRFSSCWLYVPLFACEALTCFIDSPCNEWCLVCTCFLCLGSAVWKKYGPPVNWASWHLLQSWVAVHLLSTRASGRWFWILFIFIPKWRRFPFYSYFSKGLKPPRLGWGEIPRGDRGSSEGIAARSSSQDLGRSGQKGPLPRPCGL